MSIRIRVSTSRKESTTNENGTPTFGSYGAGAAISFELDPSLMANPEAFVAKIREQYAIAEAAMADDGTDRRNGVSFDQQDGSAVGGFQGGT
jgi:hypothetical protein